MKPLTDKQELVYSFIKSELKESGFPPTVREIATQFSVSGAAALDRLISIEKKGYIHREPGKPRAIKIIIKDEEDDSSSGSKY